FFEMANVRRPWPAFPSLEYNIKQHLPPFSIPLSALFSFHPLLPQRDSQQRMGGIALVVGAMSSRADTHAQLHRPSVGQRPCMVVLVVHVLGTFFTYELMGVSEKATYTVQMNSFQ